MPARFISEDLLRHLWSLQYLSARTLATLDGRDLTIHAPGTLNRESGPDFRNAVIEIAGTTYRGDIEFHRSIEDWQAHRHADDPHYNRVILHVVLNEPLAPVPATLTESGRAVPVLVLSGALTLPPEKITDALAREEYFSQSGAIACCRMNEACPAAAMTLWLAELAARRLARKRDRFYARLCELAKEFERSTVEEPHKEYDARPGAMERSADPSEIPLPDAERLPDASTFGDETLWEQLLFEAVMDCLGYAKNREPMRALAREVSIMRMKRARALVELQPFDIQALLFAFSGLLPDVSQVSDQESKVAVHELHSAWLSLESSLRASKADHLFALPAHHRAEWIFAPTRPSNFPTVRLAAGAALASKLLFERLFARITAIIQGKYVSADVKRVQLREAFEPGADSFWSFHYSFAEASSRPHAILGEARIDDIIVNAVIPVALLYAGVFEGREMAEHTMNIAREMPPLADNAILRKLERQLFRGKLAQASAYEQQGALELYTQFCLQHRCGECGIGQAIAKTPHAV